MQPQTPKKAREVEIQVAGSRLVAICSSEGLNLQPLYFFLTQQRWLLCILAQLQEIFA